MSEKSKMVTVDGNGAAARVAYAFSEIAAIYPITPSSPMGENADSWASFRRKNLFGNTVDVVEMQSEAGAAGAVHGSLSAGGLTTTFTASQGLLLMLPAMHKIAGEMLPAVFHVSARSIAAQSLSIFCDHSDVMAARNTGFAITAASSVQETMDMALVAHLSTLESQIPFLSFFDGFRTSHEVQKVEEISFSTMRSLLDLKLVERFRERAMRPEKPIVRVAAQNPDVYFQGRESINKYYDNAPAIVQKCMDKVAQAIGRAYHLFDYVGDPQAQKVIVAMGSCCDTIEHTVKHLCSKGHKVGLVKVRLYRPFSVENFMAAIPESCRKIAVLDRTKEPGSIGEPLFLDVVASLAGREIKVVGGRYGLSSKEFTPSHAKAVYDHLDGPCFHNFTVGIDDDVTKLSIPVRDNVDVIPKDVINCIFWGLGSDGTVGANKNSIKIIGEHTSMMAQAFFVYDSKKSGGITTSHLRFGKSNVNMPWLITHADFVACHNVSYLGRYDMLSPLKEGGTFLLNSEIPTDHVFECLTRGDQEILLSRKIKFYNIDALKIAEEVGLGHRINTVMQAAFFKISGVLPEDKAIALIKNEIKKTFFKKGADIVEMNWRCVDRAAAALERVSLPPSIEKSFQPEALFQNQKDPFIEKIIRPVMCLKGDSIPVSAMSIDGTLPTGTSALEKRGIAPRVPKWLPHNCIQCNQCVMACPHAVVRAKQMAPSDLTDKPGNFETVKSKTKNDKDLAYRLQVYVEDCTGCGVCVEVCPAKQKALTFSSLEEEKAEGQRENCAFFEALPDDVTDGLNPDSVKGVQFKKPLFEFSGACAGCGETPYVKLATQLFGNRMIIANATGCSSIYGGTFPTVPYTKDEAGRGPSWGNSLFEDNAEYGFGMRLAVDGNRKLLRMHVEELISTGGVSETLLAAFKASLLSWKEQSKKAYALQNKIALLLPQERPSSPTVAEHLRKIRELKDYFVDKSIWILGGDGWAYDIGYGGLDHVLAAGRDVNVLVLDTEVYSNTGGQASKATPIGAVAQFATTGMRLGKKDLGAMTMLYGYVYVASVAMGADRNQTQKAFLEAEAYPGPSIIFAYSPCIAHGIDMQESQKEEKRAVDCGYWPLYRYHPAGEKGKRLTWDAKEPKGDFEEFLRGERRFTALEKMAPADVERLFCEAKEDAARRMSLYRGLSEIL